MTEDADKATSRPLTTALTVSDSAQAPILFFDGVSNFGTQGGVVNVTLAANRHLIRDGAIVTDVIAVGFLRCTVETAMSLRKALDDALLLGAKTEGQAN